MLSGLIMGEDKGGEKKSQLELEQKILIDELSDLRDKIRRIQPDPNWADKLMDKWLGRCLAVGLISILPILIIDDLLSGDLTSPVALFSYFLFAIGCACSTLTVALHLLFGAHLTKEQIEEKESLNSLKKTKLNEFSRIITEIIDIESSENKIEFTRSYSTYSSSRRNTYSTRRNSYSDDSDVGDSGSGLGDTGGADDDG